MKILSRNPCCSGHFLGYVACAFCRLIRLLITAPLEVLHFSAPSPSAISLLLSPRIISSGPLDVYRGPDCLSSALSASVTDIVGVFYCRIEWTPPMSNCLNRILGILLIVLMAFLMPIVAFAEPAAVDSASEIVGSDGDDSPELGKDDWGSSTSSGGSNSESFDDSTSDSGMQLGSSYEDESDEVFSEGQEDEGLTGAPNLGPRVNRVLEDGAYTIASSIDSSMVLDVSGASKDDGANVQLYASNGTTAQKFRITYGEDGYYTIICLASGKALDVEGASDVSGANVQQWRENGSDAQKWSIVQNHDGSYSFISKCNGFALDIQGGVTASGTNIQS